MCINATSFFLMNCVFSLRHGLFSLFYCPGFLLIHKKIRNTSIYKCLILLLLDMNASRADNISKGECPFKSPILRLSQCLIFITAC